jgi:hypothetical protein
MTLQCARCIAVHGPAGCVATHETETGEPSCTWHLDGELCPIEQKQQRATRKKPPEEMPLNANDQDSTDRASEVKSEGTMSETRANAPETAPKMCRRPGCETTLSVANISGLCQRHARWAGARTEVAEQRREKTNGHANGARAANGSARKTNGNGHAPPAANGSNGAVGVLPALAADRVDQLLATLTARDKARIALAWLRGEL